MKTENGNIQTIKLTEYSTAGGCGCKVPSNLLSGITECINLPEDMNIMTDFQDNEDAAIYKINEQQCMVYSLDFFTPIVDDPYLFGRIAAANALSDVYAKGIQPNLALSILGYPKELDNSGIAAEVVKGASDLCKELGVSIVGGHTIYNPQIIFGLSVVGIAEISHIKRNNNAKAGDLIYLTKPIGSGILSTAVKKGLIDPEDEKEMIRYLGIANSVGKVLGNLSYVNSMTDVTGFGLLGHLVEVCRASGVSASLNFKSVQQFPNLKKYLDAEVITSGGVNNWNNYKKYVNPIDEREGVILSDPQSNGGLLLTIDPKHQRKFEKILAQNGLKAFNEPIGRIRANDKKPMINVGDVELVLQQ